MVGRESLYRAILDSIRDYTHWHNVLSEIARMTGIIRGTIALREYETGDLVIPGTVKSGLSHPMLFGWTPEEVQSYLDVYMPYDPWFEVERLHHPEQPYILSTYIAPNTVEEGKFGEWVKPIGINDSVIAKIGVSPPFWVSMNLYFHANQAGVKSNALELVTEFQQPMREAWQLGEQVRLLKYSNLRLGYLLEKHTQPAVLVDAGGEVLCANEKAKALLKSRAMLIQHADGFRFRSKQFNALLQGLMAESLSLVNKQTKSSKLEAVCDDLSLTLTRIDDFDDPSGVDRGVRLITFDNLKCYDSRKSRPVWENPLLTKRERQLVEYIANGGRVANFIKEQQLAKSTGHYHWQNAKKKLNITDRAELISLHQVYLKNL